MAITKVINDLIDLNATDATKSLKMPSGAAYSGTAQDGMVRNDTDGDSQGSASTMQHFNGTDWKNYENVAPPTLTVDYLVIAGGAGGGSNGGGGGAGGLLATTTYGGAGSALNISFATAYTVTVGAGGAGLAYPAGYQLVGPPGSDSTFDSITSAGGGGGGSNNVVGADGGSGGGGGATPSGSTAPGTATPAGQGFNGGTAAGGGHPYTGGGGGGAGATGGSSSSVGGAGGAGKIINIIGSNFTYAGGGGGTGGTQGGAGGAGGAGGGGAGGVGSGGAAGQDATVANSGSGGGSSGDAGATGAGADGVVILRYLTSSVSSFSVTGTLNTPTPAIVGTDSVITFTTGTGTVTFS